LSAWVLPEGDHRFKNREAVKKPIKGEGKWRGQRSSKKSKEKQLLTNSRRRFEGGNV